MSEEFTDNDEFEIYEDTEPDYYEQKDALWSYYRTMLRYNLIERRN